MPKPLPRTPENFDAIFQKERQSTYPVIDAFEKRLGFAVERSRLEGAARVLQCPVKENPPNWQHGRVLYALARSYLTRRAGRQLWLDIGTAKGFSALSVIWALHDAEAEVDATVVSCDILDPEAVLARNSIEDPKTIAQFVEPFLPRPLRHATPLFMKVGSEAHRRFLEHGIPEKGLGRINFAFVDGSHEFDDVKLDMQHILARQESGDVMVFDDYHMSGVAENVEWLRAQRTYDIEIIDLLAIRRYAIAIKR